VEEDLSGAGVHVGAENDEEPNADSAGSAHEGTHESAGDVLTEEDGQDYSATLPERASEGGADDEPGVDEDGIEESAEEALGEEDGQEYSATIPDGRGEGMENGSGVDKDVEGNEDIGASEEDGGALSEEEGDDEVASPETQIEDAARGHGVADDDTGSGNEEPSGDDQDADMEEDRV
jgi:hypothetical protein